jgi:hypothetical protein
MCDDASAVVKEKHNKLYFLQRWEPKTAEKPLLHREKGRGVGVKKLESQVDKGETQQEGGGKVSTFLFRYYNVSPKRL